MFAVYWSMTFEILRERWTVCDVRCIIGRQVIWSFADRHYSKSERISKLNQTKSNQMKTAFFSRTGKMLSTMSMSCVHGQREESAWDSAYISQKWRKKVVCIFAAGALMHNSISFNCHDTPQFKCQLRKDGQEKIETNDPNAHVFQFNFFLSMPNGHIIPFDRQCQCAVLHTLTFNWLDIHEIYVSNRKTALVHFFHVYYYVRDRLMIWTIVRKYSKNLGFSGWNWEQCKVIKNKMKRPIGSEPRCLPICIHRRFWIRTIWIRTI